MKKLFVAALAVLGLAACSNDEILDAPRSSAIKFDKAFIDNATRAAADPSTSTDGAHGTKAIENFNVWAFVNNYDGTVFNAEDVQLVNGSWSYVNTQYWTPSKHYYFAALSPMDSENIENIVLAEDNDEKGLGAFTFTNVDGSEDLLYAKAYVKTYDDINVVPAPVKMQFQHLLSKVKFTFANGFTTENASVVIRDIKMTAPKSARIDVAKDDYSKAWVLGNEDDVELDFGDVERLYISAPTAECAQERLTIPADENRVYDISFTVDLYMGAQLAMTVDKTSSVSNVALEMGNAYNFKAEVNPDNLGMAPIEFEVEVEKWVPEDDYNNVEAVAGTPVRTYAELVQVLSNDGARAVLVNDINANQPNNAPATRAAAAIEIPEGNKAILDLNGYSIIGATIVNNGELSLINSSDDASDITADTEESVIINNGTLNVQQNVFITNENEDGDAVENGDGAVSNIANLITTAEELQAAIDNAIDNYTVVFANKIEGNVTILQKAGINLVIDGAGNEFDGVITVNGNGRSAGAETLTIQNINFATASSDFTFISAPSKINNKYNYSHNVTIENCTFTGNETVGAASFTGTYNFVMKNCTATNMHSLLQTQSVDNKVIVENVTVKDSKSGLAFGNAANVVVKNANINAAAYGIRADGNASRGNLVIEASTIVANQPIVVRKMTTKYNVEIDEATTLTPVEAVYHVAFTNADDAPDAYAKPTGSFTIKGAEELYVYPSIVVANADELVEALEEKSDVVFANDIKIAPANMSNAYGTTGINVKNGQEIDGRGYTLDIKGAGGTWDSGINTTGGLIKNIKVTGSFRGIFINHNSSYSEKVVLDNVILDGTTYTISCDQGLNQGLEANNSTFNGWTSYAKTIGDVVFNNCKFGEGNGNKFARPYAPTVFNGCNFCEGYTVDPRAAVTFENCTLNGVALTVENIANLVTKTDNVTVK